ncbi:hypothetical protein L6259_00940 [Candidatus Parcubacteria bacterium]|nr:hypothetical protein [Patescibacteria group bacterium]MCG2693839.1 hypothetical protein [Candidatus Parcubacteria bacterium]
MKDKQKVAQRHRPHTKIILKKHIKVDFSMAEATRYIFFQHPCGAGISIYVNLIEVCTDNHILLKKNLVASVELSDFDYLHLTKFPPMETGLPPEAYGPCLPLSYIEKIIDENTGKQLWPPRGPTF